MNRFTLFLPVLAGLVFMAHIPARAQMNPCGPIENAFGPYDYRKDKDKLPIVDNAHFPPIVEQLIRGNRSKLGGDLDYTLRAFPNHHRALIAVMRYGLKTKSPQPDDLPRPVECYFDRALRFRPDDHLSRMIYSEFLRLHNRPADAVAQLDMAVAIPGLEGPSLQNIGFAFVELGKPDRARAAAWQAIRMDIRPIRLIDRLSRDGAWQEPPEKAQLGAHAGSEPAASAAE